jgi:hypothetical protein
MKKKKFDSQLFRREILPTEKDYFPIVYAELLYRIDDLETQNCSCFKCMEELEKYKNTLIKIKELLILK